MTWWQRILNRINKCDVSTTRTKDGKIEVRSNRFKGLPIRIHREINDILENQCKGELLKVVKSVDSLEDAKNRSAELVPMVLNSVGGPASLVERVADAIGFRDFATGNPGGRTGGISNLMWATGVGGKDPSTMGRVSPNLYITPGEAATVYSQKGLPEVIINKKARSMLLNGVHIKNPFLSAEQHERIAEDMIKTGLPKAISDSVLYSLVYSGSLLFPFFKHDSPLSMTLDVPTLAKYGVIRKDCIDRWTVLDRWNTVHFPQWNPTAADFLKPRYFYIPFLGVDVHSSRMARVVTTPQPGYWGVLMNMGWGVSDIPGWIEAVFNYYNIMHAIPTMIQQMSLLVRSFNVEGPLAMEGAMILNQMADEDTIRIREASVLNPINLDVVGKLEAIQRDFQQVPELTRLVRQDLAAKAGMLEESLFTVEKKGMGGGGDKKAPWTRQEETNRLMYTAVQDQLRPIAKLQVINALGLSRDVLKALPYTEISFDEQKVTDIEDRVKVVAATSKGFFDAVAGGMPLPDAADMMEQLSGGLFKIDADLRSKLEERQALLDEREEEMHNAEIKAMEMSAMKPTSSSASGGGHSYADPMEQKKHEKVSHKGAGTKKQGLAKARNKKLA